MSAAPDPGPDPHRPMLLVPRYCDRCAGAAAVALAA
jgi:hypothetical protein